MLSHNLHGHNPLLTLMHHGDCTIIDIRAHFFLPFPHLSVLVYKAVQHKQWLIFSTPIPVRSADVVWLFLKMQWIILMTKHFGPIVYFSKNHHSGWICPYGSVALTQSSHLSSVCVSGSRWASARWEHLGHVFPDYKATDGTSFYPLLSSLPATMLCIFLVSHWFSCVAFCIYKTRFLTLHNIHCWSYWFSVH